MVASDHKPVMALFDAAVRTTVVVRRQSVYLSILKQLGEMESLTKPKVDLAPADGQVDFGRVAVGVASQASIDVTNTSTVAASFRFVTKPEETVLFPPWLVASPSYGMLPPGESCTITFTAGIGPAVARDLALGRPTMSEVLILRIEKGRDFFICVSGQALPSCFGCSPSQLAGRVAPMHELAGSVLLGDTADTDLFETVIAEHTPAPGAHTSTVPQPSKGGTAGELMKLPKEVWRLVDAVMSDGRSACPGLLVCPGEPVQVVSIRESLDSGAPFLPGAGALSFGQVLIELLTSFLEPVVPCAMFPGDEFDAMPSP